MSSREDPTFRSERLSAGGSGRAAVRQPLVLVLDQPLPTSDRRRLLDRSTTRDRRPTIPSPRYQWRKGDDQSRLLGRAGNSHAFNELGVSIPRVLPLPRQPGLHSVPGGTHDSLIRHGRPCVRSRRRRIARDALSRRHRGSTVVEPIGDHVRGIAHVCRAPITRAISTRLTGRHTARHFVFASDESAD